MPHGGVPACLTRECLQVSTGVNGLKAYAHLTDQQTADGNGRLNSIGW